MGYQEQFCTDISKTIDKKEVIELPALIPNQAYPQLILSISGKSDWK
jgi:hypothetical protein